MTAPRSRDIARAVPGDPMTSKFTLAVAVATFVAALLVLWHTRDARDAVRRLERSRAASQAPASIGPTELESGTDDAAEASEETPPITLEALMQRLEEVDDAAYEYYTGTQKDLYDIRRALGILKGKLTRLQNALAESGRGGVSSALPMRKQPMGQEDIKRLAAQAAEHGVKVEPGKVTVRAFLNMAPRKNMPLEYFMTRYPEANHETLVHVIGNKPLEAMRENPREVSAGLATALYKGLLAAGFKEGDSWRPDPDVDPAEHKENPKWLLPDGDVIYISVRYELEGKIHEVPATSWVLDPKTEKPLPADAIRFSGSRRVEHPETGEEAIACEFDGLLVSVWPARSALMQVALPGASRNDYRYNAALIPEPEKLDGPLYMDVVFSKEPQQSGD